MIIASPYNGQQGRLHSRRLFQYKLEYLHYVHGQHDHGQMQAYPPRLMHSQHYDNYL